MTVYNHIAGGIVFTGVFSSLFNVNIFESKYTIGLTVFACILPDIDHTKSLIGKLFFPLSVRERVFCRLSVFDIVR